MINWYRSGTVNLTNGSKTVVGVGTNWANQQVGWVLVTEQDGTLHEIAEVVSTTEILLAEPVSGATATGLTYYIIPTFGLSLDLARKFTEYEAEVRKAREAWEAVYEDFSATTYQLWISEGNTGTVSDFLTSLESTVAGPQGDSAYQVWLDAGNVGTVNDYLDDLSNGAVVAAQLAQAAAETAEASASADATQVAADRVQVESLFDQMDDSWLGSKATDPTTDNDGDPLLVGARYYNTTSGEWRVWDGVQWEAPVSLAATSASQAVTAKDQALAAQTSAEAAQTASEAAQVLAESARDTAQDHANAASLASNASEWVSGSNLVQGELVWSPTNGVTYRAVVAITNSVVDPANVNDEAIFVEASGGGSGGGGFTSLEIINGDLVAHIYDPSGNAQASDFTITNGFLEVTV